MNDRAQEMQFPCKDATDLARDLFVGLQVDLKDNTGEYLSNRAVPFPSSPTKQQVTVMKDVRAIVRNIKSVTEIGQLYDKKKNNWVSADEAITGKKILFQWDAPIVC